MEPDVPRRFMLLTNAGALISTLNGNALIFPVISILVLLSLSAFFSASETALTSLSRIRLRSMLDADVKGARAVEKLADNMKKLISTILVGNNLVNIALSSLATSLTIELTGNNSLALGVTTVAVTLLILVFGEITPKTLASQNSDKISLRVSRPLSFFIWLLSPIVAGVNRIIILLLTLLGANKDQAPPLVTEAELKTMINMSQEQGVLQIGERQMINNVFAFGDYKARDVMTPRTDIAAVPYEAKFEEIVKVFEDERFSRMPVYKESTDHIVGILYFKDFAFRKAGSGFRIDDFMRRPFFTYESKPTGELFTELRTKRIPMAIVLDEYGGTAGLLTLEDLIEEIVGEISDEYDDLEEEIAVIRKDEYVVEGGARIDDVNEMLGTSMESEDYDSIGGYVIGVLGYIPKIGETVETGDIKFVIEEIDKNRIEKLRIFISNNRVEHKESRA